jgi:hypothetical protein
MEAWPPADTECLQDKYKHSESDDCQVLRSGNNPKRNEGSGGVGWEWLAFNRIIKAAVADSESADARTGRKSNSPLVNAWQTGSITEGIKAGESFRARRDCRDWPVTNTSARRSVPGRKSSSEDAEDSRRAECPSGHGPNSNERWRGSLCWLLRQSFAKLAKTQAFRGVGLYLARRLDVISLATAHFTILVVPKRMKEGENSAALLHRHYRGVR